MDVSLPQTARSTLYDIDLLLPSIDAGVTLLTPNSRLARRIKTVWDSRQLAAGKTVWQPLLVMSLEGWLRQRLTLANELGLVEPAVVLSDAQSLELWQEVIAEHQRLSSSYSLLRPQAAAALAGQATETLLRWQVDVLAGPARGEFGLDEDCATYLEWHDAFALKLEAKGFTTFSRSVKALLGVADSMPKPAVALLDFDDIPPLYRACVEACSSTIEVINNQGQRGECVARAFPDQRSELRAAARWAKQRNEEDPLATVAVILPNMNQDRSNLEYLLRREFLCFEQNYQTLPVNFSAGVSLDTVPVVKDALGALGLAGQHVKVTEVVALLQSRFLALPDANSALVVKLITGLYADGREQIETGSLRNMASHIQLGEEKGLNLGDKLMAISQLRALKARHKPSMWVSHLSAVLDIWGWPGPGPLDSWEYQQVEMWYRLMDEFASFDAVSDTLSVSDALQLLKRSAAAAVFQPQTADSSIQVLGMLEGAGLAFDHLWICSMQGNTFPAPARPSPMIPLSIQRECKMPHASAEREWEFATALMRRYVCSAKHVNASYVQSINGVPELPSALLEDFAWSGEESREQGFDPAWLEQRSFSKLESVQDAIAPAVGAAESARLGGGSGLVEDQSHCPFRAFAKRRLKVQPLGDFQMGLSAAARGSILHDALFALWGGIGNSHTLASMPEKDLQKAIVEASESALQSIPARLRIGFGEGYLKLEAQRLCAVLGEWVLIEKQRSEFVVQAREHDISLSLPPLQIKLRVDRIDRLPDGSALIVDYKSGRSKVSDWLGDRPAKPQLLLYGIASAKNTDAQQVSALAFAQVRAGDCAYIGAGSQEAAPGIRTDIAKLVGDKHNADDWGSLNEVWQLILENLVADFAAGEAAVDPRASGSCDYCGLQSLCRIGDAADLAV
jgi:ATP-dependent helicase/nuclease subunit B